MKFAKRAFCLSLTAVMLLSASACKKSKTGDASDLSDDVEIIYQYESGTESGAGSGTASSSSGKNNQSGKGNTSGSSGKNNIGNISADKLKKYKGTTVTYATWRDPNSNEDGAVVKAFQKKYGINVKIDNISQANYVNLVLGRIASGDSPDIFFCTDFFPSGLQCLQPLDVTELDLTEDIWDKDMLEKSKVNGKSYLLNTVGNIWNELGCVYYNKKIFRENNITTPEEYYKAGKWTFETFEKAMRDVRAASKDYMGAYVDLDALIGSTGNSAYVWNNGKFTNGLNERVTDVIRYAAQWKKDGLIRGVGNSSYTSDFKNGMCGMVVNHAWGLKKTGYWRNMNYDDVGFTYIPSFDSKSKSVPTGIYRAWGIVKGAKNPVGAGIFLRYYLDVNNYDTNSAFINSEAESFFFKLTSGSVMESKNYYCGGGVGGIANSVSKITEIANSDPEQVKSKIDALQNSVNSDINSLNAFMAKIK